MRETKFLAFEIPCYHKTTFGGARVASSRSFIPPNKQIIVPYCKWLAIASLPFGLYLTQLRERLGDAAVRQVAAASQIG